jgi:hypothetical protein
MLNSLPDTRKVEFGSGFLKPNAVVGGDHEDEIEGVDHEMPHESIDMGERRKSSVYSGQSDSASSTEVPQRDPTVDMGKKDFIFS